MGLTATLGSALDCSSLGDALLGQLRGHGTALGSISVPSDSAGTASVSGAAAAVNPSPVASAAAQLAGRIPQALSALPGVDGVVQPLTAIVGLAGQLAANDVPTLFEQVLGRLKAELAQPGPGGHAALLLRLAQLLQGAPEGQALRQLLEGLVPSLGQAPGVADFPLLDILRGIEGATQTLGALMCLQTVLAEAQQLSATMSTRLDPAALRHRQAALQAALGSGPTALAARAQALDVDDAAALAALVAETSAAALALAELRELFALSMAMDEATLAYLDLDRLQGEIDAARAMLRAADVAPARRAVQALANLLQPLMNWPLPPTPAGGLDALLVQVEARVAEVAQTLQDLDLGFFTRALTDGLRTLTQPLRDVQALIDQVLLALRTALEQLRRAVASLPLDDLAQSLRAFLAPVSQALDAVADLVAGLEAALRSAVDATSQALQQVDGQLDHFKQDIDAFFGEARSAVDQVDVQAALGAVSQKVQEFAQALAQADMKPVFDAAVTAIDAATDVVKVVPFDLLPASMKSDVDALVQPIKSVDVDAAERDIEAALGIQPDGGFALRGDLEAAIETVHQKFQQLLDTVEQRSPRLLLAELDQALDDLAEQVRTLEPDLTLEPVRQAIDSVRGAIEGIDLDGLLQPVREAFGQITQALDSLSVAQAVAPLQQEIDQARQSVIATLRLDQWESALDTLRSQALTLLQRADPAALQGPIVSLLDEVRDTLQRLPSLNAGAGLGVVVAALLGSSGRRIQPASLAPVLGWLSDAGGQAASVALAARSDAVAQALERAATLLDTVDPAAAGVALNPAFAELHSATQALALRLPPTSEAQLTLTGLLPALDSATLFGELAANRQRYQQALRAARGLAEGFRRHGFSEADGGVAALREAIAPLDGVRRQWRALFTSLGLADGQVSLAGAVQRLLQAAPPQRLVGLVMPVFQALHQRLAQLLDAVIDPLRAAIADLRALLNAVDLDPLVQAADGIVSQARDEIMALHPDRLLAEPLQAFADLKAALVEHDPLDEISQIIDNLQALVVRVLQKLDLELLLEVPLAIYDDILTELRQLDPRGLLTPVFDQVDAIATQVDQGLDATVASFKRLQDALPAPGGSGPAGSVSVSS